MTVYIIRSDIICTYYLLLRRKKKERREGKEKYSL